MRAVILRWGITLWALLSVGTQAYASILDTDFWCRTYGCAIVHDGQRYDIYDNYLFSQNRCCIASGTRMQSYYNTTFGDFKLTGTLTSHQGPTVGQSMQMGITQNGTAISAGVLDNGNGYLDASDSFAGQLSLNSLTDIALDGLGREYSHSFYITSRNTRFSLRARSSIASSTHDFVNSVALSDIKLRANVQASGNDSGFRFGSAATTNSISVQGNINDLGDLAGASTRLINFNRRAGIRSRYSDLSNQTLRLDFIYTMPEYDLSMGVGSVDIDMVFDFYKEP